MANETLRLELQPRTITGKGVKALRKEGILPIGVCGKGVEPFSAQVDEREFMRVINQAGYSGLIEVVMQGKRKQAAFLQELQRNPLTGRAVHADLKVVDVNKPVEIDVHVTVQGENVLVERGEAVLNVMSSTIRVRALPTEIPHQIEVDCSGLEAVGEDVLVKDLKLADGVEILSDPEAVVLTLSYPTREEPEEVVADATEGETGDDANASASDDE